MKIEMVPTKMAKLLKLAEDMGTDNIIRELNQENDDLRLENENLRMMLGESGVCFEDNN